MPTLPLELTRKWVAVVEPMAKELLPAVASMESFAHGVEVPMPTLSVLSARKDCVPSLCQPPAVA